MTHNTRRIFFYSSVIIFALIAPFLIAYSFGYIFRSETGSIETTGGIFIKSKTPRLHVFLDGAFIKETSYLAGDALLTEITPGLHRLRLEKQAFHPWSKTIQVEPVLVADFRNILLIPDPAHIATSTPRELQILRHASTNTSFVSTVPKETVSVPDLSSAHTQSSSEFFLDKKRNLVGKTATSSTILISHVNSFDVIDGSIYFIDKNGFLGRLDPVSKKIITIGRPGFYLSDTSAQIFPSPHDEIIILDSSGGLFFSNGSTEIQTITGGVRQFAFDSNGEKMLIQKDQSVDVLWLKDNTLQPFQKKGVREKIFSSNSIIQDADWFFADNAHIVIRTADGIFFAESDARGGANIVQLFFKKTDELITTPSFPNSIFLHKGKTFFTITI